MTVWPAPEQAPAGGQPPVAARHPFAGIPVSDYVIDGVAALLLLASLALPWNADGHASDRIDVVLVTLLTVLALSVHYLVRAGAVAGLNLRAAIIIRSGVAALYVLLALVYVLIDTLSAFLTTWDVQGGVGGAAAIGLAGAVMVALPRRSELADARMSAVLATVWRWVFAGFAVIAVIGQLISLVKSIDNGISDSFGTRWLVLWIAFLLLTTAIVAVPAVGVLLKPAVWTPVLRTVAGTVAVVALLGMQHNVWSVLTAAGTALVFVPALGAITLNPAFVPTGAPADRRAQWQATAAATWVTVAAVGAGLALVTVVRLFAQDWGRIEVAVTLLLTLAVVVGAVIARAARSATGVVIVGVVISLGVLLLGLVLIVLAIGSSEGLWGLRWTDLIGAGGGPIDGQGSAKLLIVHLLVGVTLPLLALYALALPGAGRELASLLAGATAGAQAPTGAGPAAPAPVAPVPAEPAPVAQPAPSAAPPHGFTAQQALDPATDLAVLARIAAEAPELRICLAANPSTYPALLEWLAQLGDPAITATLAARQR